MRTSHALHGNGYACTEAYPSFDFDYTRENTVVYMKQSVIDEYEAIMAQQYTNYNYVRYYEIFKQFFKEIRPRQAPTGIESVAANARSVTRGWYTLDGRRISQPTASGLYIHNGRKVVIR